MGKDACFHCINLGLNTPDNCGGCNELFESNVCETFNAVCPQALLCNEEGEHTKHECSYGYVLCTHPEDETVHRAMYHVSSFSSVDIQHTTDVSCDIPF